MVECFNGDNLTHSLQISVSHGWLKNISTSSFKRWKLKFPQLESGLDLWFTVNANEIPRLVINRWLLLKVLYLGWVIAEEVKSKYEDSPAACGGYAGWSPVANSTNLCHTGAYFLKTGSPSPRKPSDDFWHDRVMIIQKSYLQKLCDIIINTNIP